MNINIKVIDSIMGSGKSQYAIQLMNEDTTNDYIYITPYLDEIKRIRENCKSRKFVEPKENEEHRIFTKSKSLKVWLKTNANIATTHSLFKIIDEETKALLNASNYVLVLDEVMDVVQQIPLSKSDQWLIFEESKLLDVEENGRVILGEGVDKYEESGGNGKFTELIYMAKLGRLFKFQNVVLLWEFPVEVFSYFKEVIILTYLFDGQIQKYFFDYYDVPYTKHMIIKNNDKYEMVDYDKSVDKNRINFLKDKITIHKEEKLNSIGKDLNCLSYTWYKECSTSVKEKMGLNIYNYFRNVQKVKSQDCLWTSFKEFNLNVPSYKRAFIPHNLRATNEYSNTHTLAYCVNRYVSPFLINYFKGKNVIVNQELYGLSEMLQWIWRSRIRNDEEINIYIPSSRMRNLLIKYLDGNI